VKRRYMTAILRLSFRKQGSQFLRMWSKKTGQKQTKTTGATSGSFKLQCNCRVAFSSLAITYVKFKLILQTYPYPTAVTALKYQAVMKDVATVALHQ